MVRATRRATLGHRGVSGGRAHPYLVGDNFYLLNRGRMLAEYTKGSVSREELVKAMAGGAELDALAHELGAET